MADTNRISIAETDVRNARARRVMIVRGASAVWSQRTFVRCLSIRLAADAGARAQWLRRRAPWLGWRRYALANLLELLRRRVRPARLRLLTSDRTEELLEGRYVMVLACNTQHTGAGMRIALRALLDDGLLDLLIVPELSRAHLLTLMWRIPSGRHIEVPELRYRQVSGFELLAGKGGGRPGRDGWCLNVDGEILRGTQAAVFEVSIRRGALKLLSAPSR